MIAALGLLLLFTGDADEISRLRADIARDMQAVERKLKDNDPGDDTRQLQKRIVENIDKLIKMEAESNPEPSPSGGAGQPKPKKADGSSQSRRERREAQRRAAGAPQFRNAGAKQSEGQTPAGQPQAMQAGAAAAFSDVVKDIWGHLPDALRQDVDQYYRDQFMPRYRELVQQYYLRLAETERKPKP